MKAPESQVISTEPVTKRQSPAFPLAALLLPTRGNVSSWVSISLILLSAGLFRWSVGFWGYSGLGKPPMYGDFEAQRHWIEITSHLSVSHWYFHDLEWWGLDYPPLTAYHSWVMGRIGKFVNPSWFALHTSRGYESQNLKIFMRATALVSEYVFYIPAVVLCVRQLAKIGAVTKWESSVALTAILMQPATILIDHGHFQYNTVMLGFVAAMASSTLRSRHARACLCFVAALGFKQMALFYAPAVFAYLLGICIYPRIDIGRFVTISIATAAAFAVLVAPFLLGVLYDISQGVSVPAGLSTPPLVDALPSFLTANSLLRPIIYQLAQAVHRIFPFARGLFEDKVANVWCAVHSSGLYKLNRTDPAVMGRYALALTLVSIAPPCLVTLLKPKRELFLWSLATTSWGFFLCSYQVHEKNVLLPLLPMTLLLAGSGGLTPSLRAWIGFANILGCWTMFPLLERDELRVPYAVLTLLWAWLLGLPPTSISMYFGPQAKQQSMFTTVVHLPMYAAMIAWHVAKVAIPAPERFPDLWVVGNVCIGTAGFGMCYLWCLWNMLTRSGLVQKRQSKPASKRM